MNQLMNWPHPNYETFTYENIPREIRIEMKTQYTIGWRPFIYGRAALAWQSDQEKWLRRILTKWMKSSQAWLGSLVSVFFTLTRTIWENINAILLSPEHTLLRIKISLGRTSQWLFQNICSLSSYENVGNNTWKLETFIRVLDYIIHYKYVLTHINTFIRVLDSYI